MNVTLLFLWICAYWYKPMWHRTDHRNSISLTKCVVSPLCPPMKYLIVDRYISSFCLLPGKGGRTAATDGFHGSSRNRIVPDGWRDMARAKREESGSDGGDPDWCICSLLDSFFPCWAHHSTLFVRHPTCLEKCLSLAGLLKLLLQPTHLHSL